MKAGWEVKRLVEVTDLITCGVAKRPDYVEKGIPFLSARNVKNGEVIWRKYQYVSEETHLALTKNNKPELGDILYTRVGSYGEAAIIEKDIEFSIFVSLTLIKPKPFLLNSFLKYYLNSPNIKQLASDNISGSGVGNLNVGTVREFPIPIPPLPEQQRIVAILDAAFASIATAKANTEQNLKNARALFDSYLHEVFADYWKTCDLVTLTDLTTDITDGDHMPPPKAPNGVSFITIGNIVKDTRTIDFSNTFSVSQEYFDKLKVSKKPKYGDVLYTVTGSFGIPVLITENRDFCFQRHIGLVRPKPDVNSEWIYYLLMSPQIVKQANDGATGTAQKTVSLKLLRGFQVPLVKLENQQTTVKKLNAIQKETQRLETLYQRKLTALDELKKALLHQAFAGEL